MSNKKFKVGDTVSVKANSRCCQGDYAQQEGTIIEDDYDVGYPYLVSFAHKPKMYFHANELELLEAK